MEYLTHDEILQTYISGPPFRIMNYHNPDWWERIKNHELPSPVKIRFGINFRNQMPEELKKAKGLYMFFIETEHPFPVEIYIRHLLYVGRVLEGESGHNFYKRMYNYIKDIGNKNAARNRMRLTNLWPEKTFVYFFDLSFKSDNDIIEIEKNIFNNIIPPLNEELHGEARATRQFY